MPPCWPAVPVVADFVAGVADLRIRPQADLHPIAVRGPHPGLGLAERRVKRQSPSTPLPPASADRRPPGVATGGSGIASGARASLGSAGGFASGSALELFRLGIAGASIVAAGRRVTRRQHAPPATTL